jgi:hypothetical protein
VSGYKVGDEVRVLDINNRHPEGGWPGEVVKVGRTLVTVAYLGAFTRDGTEQFRIDTGRKNDDYGHYRIETPEQVAEVARRKAAVALLRERGVELSNRATFTLEQIEALAEVVRNWED